MAAERVRRLEMFFYKTDAGNEPVREWLKSLSTEDRKLIGFDLLRVQEQWPIGMPVCRSLGKVLWEVRTNLTSNQTARVLFFVDEDRIGVVHGFVKKTQKTPSADLNLALKRMKEMTS